LSRVLIWFLDSYKAFASSVPSKISLSRTIGYKKKEVKKEDVKLKSQTFVIKNEI